MYNPVAQAIFTWIQLGIGSITSDYVTKSFHQKGFFVKQGPCGIPGRPHYSASRHVFLSKQVQAKATGDADEEVSVNG